VSSLSATSCIKIDRPRPEKGRSGRNWKSLSTVYHYVCDYQVITYVVIVHKCPQCSPYDDTGRGKGILLAVEGEKRPGCEDWGYSDGRAGVVTAKKVTAFYPVRDPWRTSLPGYISQWRFFFYQLIGL
jgi:hypothetical protein